MNVGLMLAAAETAGDPSTVLLSYGLPGAIAAGAITWAIRQTKQREKGRDEYEKEQRDEITRLNQELATLREAATRMTDARGEESKAALDALRAATEALMNTATRQDRQQTQHRGPNR